MPRQTNAPTTAGSRLFAAYLVLTAITSGALVMVIEVLGSRVIGPFFGVSLFVWTSLISVTLVSLAVGYALGGWLADRRPSPDWLYGIILCAGLSALLVPALKAPVLKACLPLGLRLGSLVSTLALFGPALFLLGCVSPYVVRIAAREVKQIGRTVGTFYALSTAGSVAGTLLTGFVLIAWLGVDRIFTVIGATLIAVAVVYFAAFRRRWAAVALLILPWPLLPSTAELSKVMPNGTRVTLVEAVDSFYGSLKVVDYTYGEHHTREMIIDGLIQGGVDMRNGLPVYGYPYFLQQIPRALHPSGRSCLVIGLGPGIIPRWYQAQGVRTDVVEIDPRVLALAERYFDFRANGRAYVADARAHLAASTQRYDFLILDVFTGDITPAHLVSKQAVALIERRLNPGGVLAINMVGTLRGETLMTASVVRTLRTAFDQVDIYPIFDPGQDDASGNMAVIAYDGEPRHIDPDLPGRFPVHRLAQHQVTAERLSRPFRFPEDTPAIVLDDDYNPIDVFDARLRESVRREILDGTDWDILLRGG